MGDVLHFPAARARPMPSISKKELSQRLGVSKRWIEYRMNEGMPFRKDWPSRSVRFDVAEVEAWLNGRRAG